MAEWLGRALQKLVHQFESGRDLERKMKPAVMAGFVVLELIGSRFRSLLAYLKSLPMGLPGLSDNLLSNWVTPDFFLQPILFWKT